MEHIYLKEARRFAGGAMVARLRARRGLRQIESEVKIDEEGFLLAVGVSIYIYTTPLRIRVG